MKRLWQILNPAFFVSAAGGCGLLHVPYLQSLPSHDLQRIIVHDLENSEPIEANVAFTANRWENWLEPKADFGEMEAGSTTRPVANPLPGNGIIRLSAVPIGQGAHQFKPEHRWSSVMVWWPLPPVLGCFLYKCYDGRVQITAPGHKGVWVGNAVSSTSVRAKTGSNTGARMSFERDGLHVFLPPG